MATRTPFRSHGTWRRRRGTIIVPAAMNSSSPDWTQSRHRAPGRAVPMRWKIEACQ
jgi:hypothetical protein